MDTSNISFISSPRETRKDVGIVQSVGDGIARVLGLKNVKAGELVVFENGVYGMALNLESELVGVVIFVAIEMFARAICITYKIY